MPDDGRTELATAVHCARDEFADELVAVYALGSLAHGGFAPLVSDVDAGLVVARAGPGTARRVAAVADRVRRRVPGPLAERLSLFWADPGGVRDGPGRYGRLGAVDRTDLLDSGRLLDGTDVRAGARRPDRAELARETARFGLERVGVDAPAALRDPAALVAAGPRPLTKAVLFPVRFRYTLRRGRIGTNAAAAADYTGSGATLVAAAVRWREEGVADTVLARVLVQAHLAGLYTAFLDACPAALDPDGDRELVAAARDLRLRLG